MIPQSTLETITSALKAEGLTGQLEPPVTPNEDIQKSLSRHADKEAVWYADASLVTPAAKRNIMKALGSLGVAVTAYGVLVPVPTASNGAGEPVEPPAPVVPETLEADGAGDEPAPDAPAVAPAEDAPTVEPAKPRVEVRTHIQTFKINQPESMRFADTELQEFRNDGWQTLNITAVINVEAITPEYIRVVTLERTV